MSAKILLIDNYDSFTYNLYQYLSELGAQVTVKRNDAITADQAIEMAPSHLVISPGPGSPAGANVSNEVLKVFEGKIPILGVCLGHQCLGAIHGATVSRAAVPMHGKTSSVYHDGRGVFRGLPNPFAATRYHSLIVQEEGLPKTLEITAHTKEGEIMGLRVKGVTPLVEGIQFHPESILTTVGKDLLKNFVQHG